MMRSRAVVFSILVHLFFFACLGGFYWRRYEKEQALLTAPIGDVFVQEGGLGGNNAKPKAREKTIAPEEKTEVAQGDSEAEAGEGLEGGSGLGLPDGEAFPLGKISPDYPPISRQLGEQGSAVFLLGIAEDGTVTSAVLEKSSGFKRLDEAARSTLLQARFQPAVESGAPLPSIKRYTVDFRLQDPRKTTSR
jgi:TonB family protein